MFPPLISGGLGTACHAIVKELARRDVGLTLVLPQTANVSGMEHVNFISCDYIVALDEDEFDGMVNIKYPAVATYLYPYISAKDFRLFLSNETLQDFFALLASMHLPEEFKAMAIATTEVQMLGAKITGKYGINLLRELFCYALIAGVFAKNVEHDVIYVHDWLAMLAALEAKHNSHRLVVLHIHALETDRSGMWIDKRIFAIEKYGMDQADRIIAVSQYTKAILSNITVLCQTRSPLFTMGSTIMKPN